MAFLLFVFSPSVTDGVIKSVLWQTLQALNFCHKHNVSTILLRCLFLHDASFVPKTSEVFWKQAECVVGERKNQSSKAKENPRT